MPRTKAKLKVNSVAQPRGIACDSRLSAESLRATGGVDEAVDWITRRASKSAASTFESVLRDLSTTPDILTLLLTCTPNVITLVYLLTT